MLKIGDRVTINTAYIKKYARKNIFNKNYCGKIKEISYGTKTIFHVMFDNLSWAWLYETELIKLTILCA